MGATQYEVHRGISMRPHLEDLSHLGHRLGAKGVHAAFKGLRGKRGDPSDDETALGHESTKTPSQLAERRIEVPA